MKNHQCLFCMINKLMALMLSANFGNFAIVLKMPDKKLAILSMIESILQFMNDYNTRVCQPGQLQRLMVGVVQGRLPGVNIDGVDFLTKINGDLALDLFLKDQKRKRHR